MRRKVKLRGRIIFKEERKREVVSKCKTKVERSESSRRKKRRRRRSIISASFVL